MVSAWTGWWSWLWSFRGGVPQARTPSITLMRHSAQHLFSLSRKLKASGFCPLEACLVFFFPFANSKGLEWLGQSLGHRTRRVVRMILPRPGEGAGRAGSPGRRWPAHGGPHFWAFQPGFLPEQLCALILWKPCLNGLLSSLRCWELRSQRPHFLKSKTLRLPTLASSGHLAPWTFFLKVPPNWFIVCPSSLSVFPEA